MKEKSDRKDEAKTRQKSHDELTIGQKIAKLDDKFGKGLGAKKERAKLNKLKLKQESKK